uniref:Uncharacterized protein n=1 Tax=Amazona collaria TaxID=241587 RepID=A0A8B9FTB5_9PSIT
MGVHWGGPLGGSLGVHWARSPPRRCGAAAMLWTFGYLLFFRTPELWGLPEPPPYANALQLLLTLKMVSMASDVQDLREAGPKAVTSEEADEMIGGLKSCPGLVEILCYSYCYLGLLTGAWGLWGSVGVCGDLWGCMGIYGVHGGLWGPWGSVGSMGVCGVHVGLWGSMGIYGGLWRSVGSMGPMEVYGVLWGLWGPTGSMGNYGDLGGSRGVYGVLWGSMGVYGALRGLWEFVGRYGSLWVPMGPYGSPWSQ